MKLFSRNKKTLSLDFGSSSIKIVEGQASKGSINVLKAETILIPEELYSDEEIIELISVVDEISRGIKYTKLNRDLPARGIINSFSIITK